MSSPFPFFHASQHIQGDIPHIPQSDPMEIEFTEVSSQPKMPSQMQRQDKSPPHVERKKQREEALITFPIPMDLTASHEQDVQRETHVTNSSCEFLSNLSCFQKTIHDVVSLQANLKKSYLKDNGNLFAVWCDYKNDFYFSFTVSSPDKYLHINLSIYNTGIVFELPAAGIFFHPVNPVNNPDLFLRNALWFLENGNQLYPLAQRHHKILKGTSPELPGVYLWVHHCQRVALTTMPPMIPASPMLDQKLVDSMHNIESTLTKYTHR